MKFLILASAAAAIGLVSVVSAQSLSTDAVPVSPEQMLLQEATALAGNKQFQEAWHLLVLPTGRGKEGSVVTPSRLGWRVASVAGALRNRSDDSVADAFARFALMQSWTEPGQTLSRTDLAEAGYWCAWLASEILSDRASALAWIEEAAKADPQAERVHKLRASLEDAERSFPTR